MSLKATIILPHLNDVQSEALTQDKGSPYVAGQYGGGAGKNSSLHDETDCRPAVLQCQEAHPFPVVSVCSACMVNASIVHSSLAPFLCSLYSILHKSGFLNYGL